MSLNHQAIAMARPGVAAMDIMGMPALTIAGCTNTLRNPANTNEYLQYPRTSFVASATAIGSIMTIRQNLLYVKASKAYPTFRDFNFSVRFSIGDTANYGATGASMFLGLINSAAAITNTNPATLTNCIGVGHNGTSGNLFIYGGGSAAFTPVDTGLLWTDALQVNWIDLVVTGISSNTTNRIAVLVQKVSGNNDTNGQSTGNKFVHVFNNTSVNFPQTLLTFSAIRTKLTAVGTVGIDLHKVKYDAY